MGFEYSDVVVRSTESERRYFASDNIRRHGYEQAFIAIKQALAGLGLDVAQHSFCQEISAAIEEAFATADRHSLLGSGGVPPWNFLGLWIVNYLLAPTDYLESGYYKGSSLLSALGNSRLQNIFGFDPDPKNLALSEFPKHISVSLKQEDFSKAAPDNRSGADALVYFDDHINTAQRILEAHAKGYSRLIFDDSCGLTGTSQRYWPSMPSLYFIVHVDDLASGDCIEWPSPIGQSYYGSGGDSQLRVVFDDKLIDHCRRARELIHDWTKLPDLSDFVLWPSATAYPDMTQHLVLLKERSKKRVGANHKRQEVGQPLGQPDAQQSVPPNGDFDQARNHGQQSKEAVVFLAWGKKYIVELSDCIDNSAAFFQGKDLLLVTDEETDVGSVANKLTKIVRHKFKTNGLLRKTELVDVDLEATYDAYLFLDSDTVLLGDLSLGFEKAKQFGIAIAPAPHYSLDAFWGFDEVMKEVGVPRRGQLQYNTGVFFYVPTKEVKAVFKTWCELAAKFQHIHDNDQPFFTLAMECVGFNPYTLSISYNYRGFGDAISGDVRIWHSHGDLPNGLNSYTNAWPPRRAFPGEVDFTDYSEVREKIDHFSELVEATIAERDAAIQQSQKAIAERDLAVAARNHTMRYPWKYFKHAAKLRLKIDH